MELRCRGTKDSINKNPVELTVNVIFVTNKLINNKEEYE